MRAVNTSSLTKAYGQVFAVDSLDIEVQSGEVYGFLGPNGAGKTTTMQMLTSLTAPTSGKASVAGVSITDRATLTERIGYLPADPPVFEELTGREYLQYITRLQEITGAEIEETISSLLLRFDLVDDAERRISEYSTGMRKKIGVIGTVLHDPDVLFLDEPTSGLDPRASRTMRDIIAELSEREMTIFLSTHILPIAEELADTVGVIHEGKLVAEGSPEELTTHMDGQRDTDLESVFLELTQTQPGER